MWKFGLEWPKRVVEQHLSRLRATKVNFTEAELLEPPPGWKTICSEALLGFEPVGAPGECFAAAWNEIESYRFSDPSIVEGHFDPLIPLDQRTMDLELKIFGFKFLCGVRVRSVRELGLNRLHQKGFRYDTLEGHLEKGAEWFLLTKNTETGALTFAINTINGPGSFPHWWIRVGFHLFGTWSRKRWHREAFRRIKQCLATKVKFREAEISPAPALPLKNSGEPFYLDGKP